MAKTLGRILTAMITPMNSDGTVNYPTARTLARKLVENGSDGVVVVGTTGESPTLTKTEEQVLFAEITAELGDQYTVIAGTGSNNTAEAIKATVLAEEAGVDAALLVVPYYNKPTQEGLHQHFKAVAESTKLPCILYNVPSRTVVSLTADTVARLSKISNIIGIKEASGN
ncbi:MAG: 4-hydroxy-tetrahydrodipicolinate synthase, partial [Chloroflexi bacterium]|nr:4-hydroxy-tetrahydrodipicolinate synthase [Chloroflexota bacterium]